ncbi:MAG: 50S ribosomal protein L28 [Candidatus Shikimatogenerans bostrichidophilus]|nr:MAG: 50S ribosomal protein L28 [Candidatus Shikimatogenerans bostrichidophilus]
MSKKCDITKKKSITGNKISHSNIKTKRWFKVNIIKKKIYDIENKKWIKLKLSSYALRLIKKMELKKIFKKYNFKLKKKNVKK